MQTSPTAKYPTLTIRLDQDTLHWLRVEAVQYETSTSSIVKRALQLYYETQYLLTD
jgi:hypothetical protein